MTESTLPTTEEITEQLQLNSSESRAIVADADEVSGMTNNCVEVKHHGRDGTVIVQLMPHIAWAGDELLATEETEKMTTYEI